MKEVTEIVRREERMLMPVSASGTGGCDCVGQLSIDEDAELLDHKAWRKERYQVLTTDRSKGVYGPGHNSFTKMADGTDVCVYHARTYEEIVGDQLNHTNHHTILMKVKGNEDVYPVLDYNNDIK